ncbi:golgi phosphoprotein 3 [Nematocida sp. AWRm78]|nr:golgi phosphoprotein 3 [Nematocida sp. AWRm79]KAI5182485.1 golgi phosphoprotein 3 [Nematocida sp. AWRm78]
MDEFSPRRRDVKQENAFSSLKRLKTDLNLSEILVVFTTASGQLSIPGMYDPISMTLRALLLCELVLRGGITIDANGIVSVRDGYMFIDELHDEVYHNIKKAVHPKPIKSWLLLLNGETYSIKKDKYHIRNTRKRVGKSLVEKKILRKGKSKTKAFINLVTNQKSSAPTEDVSFKGVKSKIILDLTTYLTGECTYEECDVLKMDILICALVFCGVIDDIYLTLSMSGTEMAQKKVSEIIIKYKSSLGNTAKSTEWSIYSILRAYLKLASWV